MFSEDITAELFRTDDLKLLCCTIGFPPHRGHKYRHGNKVLVLCSAPAYNYKNNNAAAILELDEHLNETM